MILSFGDSGTKDIFNFLSTKVSRRLLPSELHAVAKRKLNMIAAASHIIDLKIPPANRLEQLKGQWSGFYSIRINDQWRICFIWKDGHAYRVEIVDYH